MQIVKNNRREKFTIIRCIRNFKITIICILLRFISCLILRTLGGAGLIMTIMYQKYRRFPVHSPTTTHQWQHFAASLDKQIRCPRIRDAERFSNIRRIQNRCCVQSALERCTMRTCSNANEYGKNSSLPQKPNYEN